MRTTRHRTTITRKDAGMALPTILLVMVVLTLLGTAAVYTAGNESLIAGNGRSELVAQSVAEAGIHEAIARLNMKQPSAPTDYRIVPGTTAGAPDPSWNQRIVNTATPGAGEVATISRASDPANALEVDTFIRYKIEDSAEQPVKRCNGTPAGTSCTGDVVRYHTDFNYGGGGYVPGPPMVGQPVLQVVSTYREAGTVRKQITAEIVRSLTNVNTPGAIRSCGPVTCQANNKQYIDGNGGAGIVQGSAPASNACGGTATGGAPIQTLPCPVPVSDLFEDVFGMEPTDMQALADLTPSAPWEPPSLNPPFRGKIVYVKGSGTSNWNGSLTVGTAAEPVILVVEGNLKVTGNATVFGAVYVMGSVTGTGNMKVNGTVLTETTLDLNLQGSGCSGGGSPTSCTSRFDPNVLGNLSQLSPFTTILWKPE